jgi:hypothetical protein
MLKESTISFSAAAAGGAKIVTVLILLFGLQFDARADISAYMSTDSGGGLGTIDLGSGVFSPIGIGETYIGSDTSDPVTLAGLGEINNTLYGVQYPEGTLYTIDTTNGSLTAVGSGNELEFQAFGSTLTTLYGIAVVDNVNTLFSIDPSTGIATSIGGTGLTLGGAYSLSTNSSVLYFADDNPNANGPVPANTPELYTLNTGSGMATALGTTSGDEFGALLLDGGTLYGGQDFDGTSLDTLDPTSGAVTGSTTLTGTSSGFAGLAPVPSMTVVPEPSSFSLLLLVVLSAGILIIKARRQTAADPD